MTFDVDTHVKKSVDKWEHIGVRAMRAANSSQKQDSEKPGSVIKNSVCRLRKDSEARRAKNR
jgi:hypothetical protein